MSGGRNTSWVLECAASNILDGVDASIVTANQADLKFAAPNDHITFHQVVQQPKHKFKNLINSHKLTNHRCQAS